MAGAANLELTETLLKSIIAKDVAGALLVMHPDVVLREADSLPYGGDWRGADGFQALFGAMVANYDYEILGYETFDAGDVVSMLATVRFTSVSTRASLTTTVVEIYRFRDGLIIEADVHPKDTAAIVALADHPADSTADA